MPLCVVPWTGTFSEKPTLTTTSAKSCGRLEGMQNQAE